MPGALHDSIQSMTVTWCARCITLSHLVQMVYMQGDKLPADRLLEWSKSFTDRSCCVGAKMVLNQVHANECFCLASHLKTCNHDIASLCKAWPFLEKGGLGYAAPRITTAKATVLELVNDECCSCHAPVLRTNMSPGEQICLSCMPPAYGACALDAVNGRLAMTILCLAVHCGHTQQQ